MAHNLVASSAIGRSIKCFSCRDRGFSLVRKGTVLTDCGTVPGKLRADNGICNARKRSLVVEDLRTCCTWDLVLCENIIPELLSHVPEVACGNAELLYLYFSILDSLSEDMRSRLTHGKLAAFFPLVRLFLACTYEQALRTLMRCCTLDKPWLHTIFP